MRHEYLVNHIQLMNELGFLSVTFKRITWFITADGICSVKDVNRCISMTTEQTQLINKECMVESSS